MNYVSVIRKQYLIKRTKKMYFCVIQWYCGYAIKQKKWIVRFYVIVPSDILSINSLIFTLLLSWYPAACITPSTCNINTWIYTSDLIVFETTSLSVSCCAHDFNIAFNSAPDICPNIYDLETHIAMFFVYLYHLCQTFWRLPPSSPDFSKFSVNVSKFTRMSNLWKPSISSQSWEQNTEILRSNYKVKWLENPKPKRHIPHVVF